MSMFSASARVARESVADEVTIVVGCGKSKSAARSLAVVQQQKQTIELNPAWVDKQLVTLFGVSPQRIFKDIDSWLEEDSGGGDVSLWSQSPDTPPMRVEIVAKQDFVLCGLPLMAAVFHRTHGTIACRLESQFAEGAKVKKGDVILSGSGDARCLLLGERVALNLAARLSGIASKTSTMLAIVETAAARAQARSPRLLETRKTTPGLRLYEKYATRLAGVRNHRHSLDTGLMLKENHLRSFGGITDALSSAQKSAPLLTRLEVEVTNLSEFRQAAAGGADVIMLDNFALDDIKIAVAERNQSGRKIELEVSGNLSEENIARYAVLGIDYLSSGALIHQATWVDMSLQLHRLT